MWKVMQAIALFATAGLVFAKDFFARIGIDADSPLVVAVGLGITTMLMYRTKVSLLVMVLFGILISLPDATLEIYQLDRDILLAVAITTLLLPWIQRLAKS
jgi:hypothetical protein